MKEQWKNTISQENYLSEWTPTLFLLVLQIGMVLNCLAESGGISYRKIYEMREGVEYYHTGEVFVGSFLVGIFLGLTVMEFCITYYSWKHQMRTQRILVPFWWLRSLGILLQTFGGTENPYRYVV